MKQEAKGKIWPFYSIWVFAILPLFILFLPEVQLIYNIVLVSGIRQSDLVIHIFQVIFHDRLLQDIQ